VVGSWKHLTLRVIFVVFQFRLFEWLHPAMSLSIWRYTFRISRSHFSFKVMGTRSKPAQYHCTVAMAIQKSIEKKEISTPCRIVTPRNFILKFGTWLHLGHDPTCKFRGRSVWRGVLPKYVKYNTFMTFWLPLFFSRPSPHVQLWHWRTRLMAQMTCFYARRCLLGVNMRGDAI